MSENGCFNSMAREFVIEGDDIYRVKGFFYDYHQGSTEIIKKELVTEETALEYLSWSSISNSINRILLEKEQQIEKQLRLSKFYADE